MKTEENILEKQKLAIRYSQKYLRGEGQKVLAMFTHCRKNSSLNEEVIISAIHKASRPLRTETEWLLDSYAIEKSLNQMQYCVAPNLEATLVSIRQYQ